jgi:site-specific recombinase XerD
MVSESLQSLSSLYITSCGIEGKSPETLRSYAETLKLFLRAVERLGLSDDPGLFRPANVYEFLGHVGSTGVSAITQWRRQRETRAFFSWLLRHDYIANNPFAKVKNIKVPQKIVQPFSPDDIQRLLSYCDAGTRKGARNQALILVLLDTGLRASELANLELGDVDFPAQRMLIKHAKGNKQRVVRFGDRTRQVLKHYIQAFRGDAPGYLLLTARGSRHLNRSAMRTIFQRLGEECGIPKVHPHRFRHTFATWAIEQQAREIDVQRLLGHSTSSMLRRYTASYDAEKAAQAHASFSPGDRLEQHPAA